MIRFQIEASETELPEVVFDDAEGLALLGVLDVSYPVFGSVCARLPPTYRRIGSLQDLLVSPGAFDSFSQAAMVASKVSSGEYKPLEAGLKSKTQVLLDMFANAQVLGRDIVWTKH